MSLRADEPAELSRKTFLEHLSDLRSAIVRSMLVLIAGMIIAAPFAPRIYRLLVLPLEKAGHDPASFLKILTVMGGFNLTMLIVVLSGLVVSAPFIVFFIAGFVFPGLTVRERRAVVVYGAAAVALFFAGVCMGYFCVLPLAMRVLIGLGEWVGASVDFVSAADYVIFCLYLLLAFGLSFELPVVLVLLGHLGLLKAGQLRATRSYAIVLILVFAMIVTPTTDVFSQLLMAVPMIVMYEISILIMWGMELRSRTER